MAVWMRLRKKFPLPKMAALTAGRLRKPSLPSRWGSAWLNLRSPSYARSSIGPSLPEAATFKIKRKPTTEEEACLQN